MHTWVCIDGSFKDGSQDPDHAINCAPCLKKRLNARYGQKSGALDQGQARSEILGRAPVKVVRNPEAFRKPSSEAISPD